MKELTNESILELPLLQFEGEIVVVDDPDRVGQVIQKLNREAILGFDTEKKPTFKKGQYHHPALVQLATEDVAYLFQLTKVGFHPELMELLENPQITKLGVAIRDDLIELNTLTPFNPEGFHDLAHLAKEIDVPYYGLRKLAAYFLDGRISKGQQTSNWENDELTSAQLQYAATDAWVALKIYEKMAVLR